MVLSGLNGNATGLKHIHWPCFGIEHHDLIKAFPHLSLLVVHEWAPEHEYLLHVSQRRVINPPHDFLRVFVLYHRPLDFLIHAQLHLIDFLHRFKVEPANQVWPLVASHHHTTFSRRWIPIRIFHFLHIQVNVLSFLNLLNHQLIRSIRGHASISPIKLLLIRNIEFTLWHIGLNDSYLRLGPC